MHGEYPHLFEEYERRCRQPSDISAHLPRLYAEACRDEVLVIELGVRKGNSTIAFLAAAAKHDGHVISVDIADHGTPHQWQQTGLWTFIVDDDVKPRIVDWMPSEVDVLFIDTSHRYEHTLAELKAYAPKVKKGGVILLHDTELEALEDEPPFPVRKAIIDFGADAEWVPGCNGLGVIRA